MTYPLVRPASTIGNQYENYRLRGIFTDITLQAGDQRFPAHRSVLQNASPFLKGLLAGHFPSSDEQNPNVFIIDDGHVEPGLMDSLLTYFYTGKITLTPDNAHALCIAAHYLQADELVSACEKYLSGKVSAENAVDFAVLADRYHLDHLLDRSAEQLCRHLPLLDDAQLMQLTKEGVELIITKLEGMPNSGTSPLEFRAKWIGHDLDRDVSAPKKSKRTVCRPRVTFYDRLFCMGGQSGSRRTVSRFDSDTDQWRAVSPMPAGRRNYAGAVRGASIYLFGSSFRGNRCVNSSVAVYDAVNDTWTDISEMLFRPNELTTAACVGEYMIVGTVSDDGKNPAYIYNTRTHTWIAAPRMLVRRTGHRLVALEGRVYAIGGRNAGTTVEMYSLNSNVYNGQWSMVTSTNYHHENHTVAVHDSKIYVYSQAGFESYDPVENTWKKLSKLNTTEDHFSTLASVNGQLLLVGGAEKNGRSCAAVYSYDAYADQWSSVPDMDVPRAGHSSFVVNF